MESRKLFGLPLFSSCDPKYTLLTVMGMVNDVKVLFDIPLNSLHAE